MLPVLLSIPHGGTAVPQELVGRVRITPEDLFDDGDACTLDIYDLGDDAASVAKTDIARAFVDMNRAPNERPPDHPDGVVKSATCLNRPIYVPNLEPEHALTELLLERYYHPFHACLEAGLYAPGVKIALDCHSMLSTAPPIEIDYGHSRPLFCLSNGRGETAPQELLLALAEAIATSFQIDIAQIWLNDPFQGGYITQRYGGGSIPIIQVEMNRCLYLAEPWFDREALAVQPSRLAELRKCFHESIERLGCCL